MNRIDEDTLSATSVERCYDLADAEGCIEFDVDTCAVHISPRRRLPGAEEKTVEIHPRVCRTTHARVPTGRDLEVVMGGGEFTSLEGVADERRAGSSERHRSARPAKRHRAGPQDPERGWIALRGMKGLRFFERGAAESKVDSQSRKTTFGPPCEAILCASFGAAFYDGGSQYADGDQFELSDELPALSVALLAPPGELFDDHEDASEPS